MRSITKRGAAGYHLDKANANPPQTADEAESRWKRLQQKNSLQNQLLDEQYGLCCYSELRADLEGLGYHIEHIQPKSAYPGQTFDYQNLAVSALSSDDLKEIKQEIFGGHAKQDRYDHALFISCLNPGSARYFAYLSDGRVAPSSNLNPSERMRANYTITLLNLNSPYLINRRRRWWDELDRLFDEHVSRDWNLECLAALDLIPSNQKLSQFFSITRSFFSQLAEQVLQQQAPELV